MKVASWSAGFLLWGLIVLDYAASHGRGTWPFVLLVATAGLLAVWWVLLERPSWQVRLCVCAGLLVGALFMVVSAGSELTGGVRYRFYEGPLYYGVLASVAIGLTTRTRPHPFFGGIVHRLKGALDCTVGFGGSLSVLALFVSSVL